MYLHYNTNQPRKIPLLPPEHNVAYCMQMIPPTVYTALTVTTSVSKGNSPFGPGWPKTNYLN